LDKFEFAHAMANIEKSNAVQKKEYWINCGSLLLADNSFMVEKWRNFVEQNVSNEYTTGMLLDETLQIMAMIKNNIPCDQIKMILDLLHCDSKKIIISYLSVFVQPEILEQLDNKSLVN